LCLVRAQHRQAGLAPRQPVFYRVEFEVESLLKGSHPLPGNDVKVRELLDQSLRGNHMGLNTPGSLTEFTTATTLKWSWRKSSERLQIRCSITRFVNQLKSCQSAAFSGVLPHHRGPVKLEAVISRVAIDKSGVECALLP
jgi:hypothetical protein